MLAMQTDNDTTIQKFLQIYPVHLWRNNGYFTDQYLHLINIHWLQFSPPSPTSHYMLAAFYSVLLFVGCCGNLLVIIMLIRCRSLRTPANILVLNLAISDFFMIAKTPVFIYNSIYLGPALGQIGCQVYGFIGGLTGTVSIATLAAIAVDRYFVIIYPLDPLKRTTKVRAGLCALFSWVYGAIFASMPLYGVNHYVSEGYLTSCSFDYLTTEFNSRLFIFIFFLAAWMVPFIIITFSYVNICKMVMHAGTTSGSRQHHKKTEVKLAVVVLAIIGLWFLAWTPYAIVALLGITGNQYLLTPTTSMIPALFCKVASCVDPYVYAVSHPRFRRELIRCFSTKRKMDMKTRLGVTMKREVEKQESLSSSTPDQDKMIMVQLHHSGSPTFKSEPWPCTWGKNCNDKNAVSY